MTRDKLTEVLTSLCKAQGISGDETAAAETALGYLKHYCKDAKIVRGNVTGTIPCGNENAPWVLAKSEDPADKAMPISTRSV